LFVALMLNRVDLTPGQGLFLPSGHLHAYLGGIGVEVMANSDNVLRGGLTDKHVDVPALLRIAQTATLEVTPLQPSTPTADHYLYAPAAEEFTLHRLQFPAQEHLHT